MSDPNRTHKTAAFRLFYHRYPMYIPRIYMYGDKYLEKHGIAVTGDPVVDSKRVMEPDIVRQTPAGIAVLHAQGCPVSLVKREDSVYIFNDIQEHLRDWERLAVQRLHPDNAPPLEDFRQLEAVAMLLYKDAMFYHPKEQYAGGDDLRDQLMSMNRGRNPVRTDRVVSSKIRDTKGELKPYISIVDRIEKLFIEELKTWR